MVESFEKTSGGWIKELTSEQYIDTPRNPFPGNFSSATEARQDGWRITNRLIVFTDEKETNLIKERLSSSEARWQERTIKDYGFSVSTISGANRQPGKLMVSGGRVIVVDKNGYENGIVDVESHTVDFPQCESGRKINVWIAFDYSDYDVDILFSNAGRNNARLLAVYTCEIGDDESVSYIEEFHSETGDKALVVGENFINPRIQGAVSARKERTKNPQYELGSSDADKRNPFLYSPDDRRIVQESLLVDWEGDGNDITRTEYNCWSVSELNAGNYLVIVDRLGTASLVSDDGNPLPSYMLALRSIVVENDEQGNPRLVSDTPSQFNNGEEIANGYAI